MLAILTVNSLSDNSLPNDGQVTLREAIAAANSNSATDLGHIGSGADTIQFLAGLGGTVNLSTIGNTSAGNSALAITSPITIRGTANGITLNAGAGATAMRHFYVSAGASLTLDTIMVMGGVARGAAGLPGENGGDGMGGAVYSDGIVSVIASTFYDNQAIGGLPGAGGFGGSGRGGAIYSAAGGAVTVRNATFSSNWALNSNGVSSNFAYGGSIYVVNGSVDVSNATMTAGMAFSGRGIYVLATGGSASAYIESSIIANAGPSDSLLDFTALRESEADTLTVTVSNNLIRRTLNVMDDWDVDPLLTPLANNGGPTLTHALQPLSPAIDAGSNSLNLMVDQRGATYAREVAGGADIGAFEQQYVPPDLVGDFNRDTSVDAADYVLWRKTRLNSVEPYAGADANGSGQVDDADLGYWTENFAEALGPGAGQTATNETLTTVTSASPSAVAPVDFFAVVPIAFDRGRKAPTVRGSGSDLVAVIDDSDLLLTLGRDFEYLTSDYSERTFAAEINGKRESAEPADLSDVWSYL
jgi:CSLREA domain-containing protein